MRKENSYLTIGELNRTSLLAFQIIGSPDLANTKHGCISLGYEIAGFQFFICHMKSQFENVKLKKPTSTRRGKGPRGERQGRNFV